MVAKPKPTKQPKKKRITSKSTRTMLEKRLEQLCREIVFWRDGSQCVERNIDGGRCRGVIQWGHLIPRQQSGWLKYDIGNTFCQCAGHNFLHDKGAQTYQVWYTQTFGAESFRMLEAEARAHTGSKYQIYELEEMVTNYEFLLDNRPSVFDRNDLVLLGYFGKWPKFVVQVALSPVPSFPSVGAHEGQTQEEKV